MPVATKIRNKMRTIFLSCFLVLFVANTFCQSDVFMEYSINDHLLKADIASDLNYMIKSIEDVHPDPYHSNSREYIHSLKDSMLSVLPDTVSRNKAYLTFKRLTAAYGEGHTDVMLFITPVDLHKYQHSFPLWIDSWNDSGFIVRDNAFDSIDIKSGDIITSINGVPESFIKREIPKYSGESATYALSQAMGLLFPLWIELLDIYSPFDIKFLRDGTEKSIKMHGVSAISYNNLYSEYLNANPPSYSFTIIENNIAYIEFNSFSNPKQFKKFLKRSFSDIRKNNCPGLIIDMRNNGGGMADLDIMLLDFINDKPYTWIYAKDTKISRYHKEFQKAVASNYSNRAYNLKGREAYFEAPDNTIYSERDTIVITPGKNRLRYSGPVCFLIGPKCFSNAQSFIELADDQGIGTLIGEPLETKPGGYADLCYFVLPETKFKFSTSTAYFFPISDNRMPVQPDILVKQNHSTTSERSDTVLEYAKKWILER